jgi:SNF2 family DNA or RNA helicase
MTISRLEDNKYYKLKLEFKYTNELKFRCQKFQQIFGGLDGWKHFKYNVDEKCWMFNIEDLDKVRKHFPEFKITDKTIITDFNKLHEAKQKEEEQIVSYQTTEAEIDLPLYPYQKVGVNFLDRVENPMLWDEMRLGKQYMTLGYIHLRKPKVIVVLCPNKTKITWFKKSQEVINARGHIVDRGFKLGGGIVNIINYEKLQAFAEKQTVVIKGKSKEAWHLIDALYNIEIDLLVIDEAHKIKAGKGSIRGELSLQLAARAKKVIQLTGTPMPKCPRDLIPQLKAAKALDKLFENEFKFLMTFCYGGKSRFGYDFTKSKNLDLLAEKLKPIRLRRTQADVWKDLPPVREDITYLPMGEPDVYKAYEKQFTEDMSNANEYFKGIYKTLAGKTREQRAEVIMQFKQAEKYRGMTAIAMVKIAKLKQEIARQKFEASDEFFEEFIESGKKALVGVYHKDLAKKLHKKYNDEKKYPGMYSIMITGEQSGKEAEELRLKFQTDPKCLFAFCTVQSVSEGLDFSAADTVVVAELGWIPDEILQFTSRIKNVGRTQPINIIYLIMNKSVEDAMIKVLLDKSLANEKVVGGEMLSKIMLQITAPKEEVTIEDLV